MRVALITYSTKPRGGVVHTLALAEALAAIGVDVSVWTLGRGGDRAFFRDVDPAVTLEVVPFHPRDGESVGERILRSIDTMAAAFRPADYDVVHAQDCISANAVPGGIRTVHHLDAFTTPELIACHDRAIAQPVALICVSAAVAAEVRTGWARTPTVIPNGVDAARFVRAAGPDGSADREYWTTRLGDYILALGGIEPRKGSIDLLEAYALLRRAGEHDGVRLVFGGGETLFDYRPYRDAFDARARELAIEPVFLGTIDDPRVPGLVAGSRALGFVSTKEGFGLAAMEALAAGVPVVARDLPVLREVFGEAVRYADTPPAIAAQLAAVLSGDAPDPHRGSDLAVSHSWHTAALSHLELYRSVLAAEPA
ncbi:MSMEG_0565 family glycosyltransferase [Cryobacterium arcticum]|uniref:Glycosyl transferase family 1 n=1 Tax=Cryobacterium arcticum TaxID=670052 RepID=A0A1B1BLD3_9MICO|nr:MSMEG_0565 family glycosyltransferase [Cryobacterium arcticum]ANP73173.1 glycosyl transferase family 1 [Cryobacterium arcticum]